MLSNNLQLVLLDDLLRPDFIPARKFIYSLISETVTQALGCTFPDTKSYPNNRGLSQTFNHATFVELSKCRNWIDGYHNIGSEAAQYLLDHLPANPFIIGYEMPPWLLTLLDSNSIQRIDLRISPLRFARDLYIAASSNLDSFRNSAPHFAVSLGELRIEASMMRASILHNELGTPIGNNFAGGVLFVGQTALDASLIGSDGMILSVRSFTDEIREITGLRAVAYKPHPYSGKFAKREARELHRILDHKVEVIKDDIYSILCSSSKYDVLTISSGVAQEALFLGRQATMLGTPICAIEDPDSFSGNGYLQFRILDFLSPYFWSCITGTYIGSRVVHKMPAIPDNLMRRLHSTWWGYSNYVIDNDSFWAHAVTRGLRRALVDWLRR